jgi:hypothetical protein
VSKNPNNGKKNGWYADPVNFFIGLVLMVIAIFIKPFCNGFHSALLAMRLCFFEYTEEKREGQNDSWE